MAGRPGTASLRILLVEDSSMNQKLMELYLGKLGHTWDLATSGEEAVRRAVASVYDVILMDVQMAGMNGLEATRRIRGQPSPGRRPWIIAVTTDGLELGRDACQAAGMDAFLAKPFLLRELEDVLMRRPARAPETTVAAAPVDRPVDAGPVRFRDLETLRDRLGPGGREAVVQLAETYLRSSRSLAVLLVQHTREQDRAMLQRDAHTLKSASAAVGAHHLASLCRRLEEDLGSTHTDPPTWPAWSQTVDHILREVDQVHSALEDWSA